LWNLLKQTKKQQEEEERAEGEWVSIGKGGGGWKGENDH